MLKPARSHQANAPNKSIRSDWRDLRGRESPGASARVGGDHTINPEMCRAAALAFQMHYDTSLCTKAGFLMIRILFSRIFSGILQGDFLPKTLCPLLIDQYRKGQSIEKFERGCPMDQNDDSIYHMKSRAKIKHALLTEAGV